MFGEFWISKGPISLLHNWFWVTIALSRHKKSRLKAAFIVPDSLKGQTSRARTTYDRADHDAWDRS